MSTKHTPGPWWATDSGVRDVGGYICHTNPPTRYPDQDERYEKEVAERVANKSLIAAAPELLEALQTTLGNIMSLGPAGALESVPIPYRVWAEVVKGAIDKATGAQP